MKISELQKILAKTKRHYGDIDIAYQRYSDIQLMDEDISVIDGVPRLREVPWITRVHEQMKPADLKRKQTYVLFPGN